jgi:hypothetical protein
MAEREGLALAAPQAIRAGEEQRQHVRFLCAKGVELRLAIRPVYRGHSALLRDVSVGGVGLLMDQPLPRGQKIAVELRGASEVGTTRVATVAHVRPHPTPPDAPWLPRRHPLLKLVRRLVGREAPPPAPCWFIGCEFTVPLPEDELRRLV